MAVQPGAAVLAAAAVAKNSQKALETGPCLQLAMRGQRRCGPQLQLAGPVLQGGLAQECLPGQLRRSGPAPHSFGLTIMAARGTASVHLAVDSVSIIW